MRYQANAKIEKDREVAEKSWNVDSKNTETALEVQLYVDLSYF